MYVTKCKKILFTGRQYEFICVHVASLVGDVIVDNPTFLFHLF